MVDILGREINRGDIIVYGSQKRCSQFLSFAETKFGIILNVIPKGKKYKIKQTTSMPFTTSTQTIQTIECETLFDKATFHSLEKVRMIHATCNRYKNGKPRIGNPILISNCLKISVDELNEQWKKAYEVFKLEFNV